MLATDPVCGMQVDPSEARAKFSYEGQTFYFCCPSCAARFQSEPRRFLQPQEPLPTNSATEWTCPMHPEVMAGHPGACPQCGMALEPITVDGDTPDIERRDMTRRFVVGLVLTLPVFVGAMSDMIPGLPVHGWIDSHLLNAIQLVLTTPIVFWCGWPFFQRAWLSILNRTPNMFTLIALGVGSAYLYSFTATVAPGLFPVGFQMPHGGIEPYFDTAAMVTVLVLLGQVLESRAREETTVAIRQLLGLAPKTARRVTPDGSEEDIPIQQMRSGDILRVRPGEKVAADGTVIEGTSAVDESTITGEPIPVEKIPESKVIAGTINGTGSLLIRAERVGTETLLARVVHLVGEARRSRAPVERLVNQVSAWFVPLVLVASLTTFVVWAMWGPAPGLANGLVNSIAVLIVACPCALGLATPMAIMVGTGRGAASGVLFRDAESLETLHRVDTLVVDKTGTLTEAHPTLVAVEPAPGYPSDELLRLAAGLERGSEHPLASAVRVAAQDRGLDVPEVSEFRSITGKGIAGRVANRWVVVGNGAYDARLEMPTQTNGLLSNQPQKSPPAAILGREEKHPDSFGALTHPARLALLESKCCADAQRAEGRTVLLVTIDGDYAGLLAIADPIRATTQEALRRLEADGIRVIMLTGDNRLTAEAVARRLGIHDVRAPLLPADKLEAVKQLQLEGRIVAMAGDGVNDAPALARANVGIAMGTGTDVAIQSAGVTLIKGDLRGVAAARVLSRATVRNISQNLFLAFAYNIIAIPVAAGVLTPWFGIRITPIGASVAMTLSSLSVVFNALRLRYAKL